MAKLEGGNVYVEVRSGSKLFCFEGPISVFIETFAHFGDVARQWRGHGAEIIKFPEALDGH